MAEPSDQPEYFTLLPDRAEYRPVAKLTLAEGIRLVTQAITHAREKGIRLMLVDTSGLTGFPSPTITDRYYFMREWAAATFGHAMRIVFIARPEMIEPDKFGITAATNAGLICEVFPTDAEALAWLQNG